MRSPRRCAVRRLVREFEAAAFAGSVSVPRDSCLFRRSRLDSDILYPVPLHSSVIPRARSRRASRLRRSRRAGSTCPVVSRGARAPRDRVARRPAPLVLYIRSQLPTPIPPVSTYGLSLARAAHVFILGRLCLYYSVWFSCSFSRLLSSTLASRLRLLDFALRPCALAFDFAFSTTPCCFASVPLRSRTRTRRSRGRTGPLVSLGDTSIACHFTSLLYCATRRTLPPFVDDHPGSQHHHHLEPTARGRVLTFGIRT